MGQRWALCILLECIPARLPGLGVQFRKEEIHSALIIGADRVRDAAVESSVDLCSSALGLFVQCREPRQLKALPNQLFDGYINDVREILHSLRR